MVLCVSLSIKTSRAQIGITFCEDAVEDVLLCEAGLAKLDEIRKLNSTKSAIRIVTNADHPIRPYFMNPNKLDEYAMQPRDPQLLFVRTPEYLGETQIDIRRIRMSSRYDGPSWKPVNEKHFDARLSAFGPETSSERYRTKTARTIDEDYGKHVKIFTDGSKMGEKVGYAVVKEEHTIKKRILPQKPVFSAEQSAIIEAILSEKNNRHENRTPTKNPNETNYQKDVGS
jgi:hypothetical protein